MHLPRNDALKAAGDTATIAVPAAVRRDFDEPRWVRWNLVRVVTSIVATGCLAWALVLAGRATGWSDRRLSPGRASRVP